MIRGGAALPLALLAAACATGPRPTPPSAPPISPVRPVERVAPNSFAFQGALTQGGLLLGTAPPGTVRVLLDGAEVPLSEGGRFLIGFGRDHPRKSEIEAQRADRTGVATTIEIAPRTWRIQSLPTLPKGTPPTPEFRARRAAEIERIQAARRIRSSAQGWQQRFVWPVVGPISGVFGSQRIYAGEPGDWHNGLDIAAPTGSPIVAPADGVVTLAARAPFTLEGHLLMIDHGLGLNSAFLHLSRIDVAEGERVVRGQSIGTVGATGRATGPHLHWSVMWQTVRIDPQMLVPPLSTP